MFVTRCSTCYALQLARECRHAGGAGSPDTDSSATSSCFDARPLKRQAVARQQLADVCLARLCCGDCAVHVLAEQRMLTSLPAPLNAQACKMARQRHTIATDKVACLHKSRGRTVEARPQSRLRAIRYAKTTSSCETECKLQLVYSEKRLSQLSKVQH